MSEFDQMIQVSPRYSLSHKIQKFRVEYPMKIRKQDTWHRKRGCSWAESESGQGPALKNSSYAHILFYCSTEFIVSILQGTKRIAEPTLSKKFECNLAHPIGDIDLLGGTRHHQLKPLSELSECWFLTTIPRSQLDERTCLVIA
jgi:hypothetical protein